MSSKTLVKADNQAIFNQTELHHAILFDWQRRANSEGFAEVRTPTIYALAERDPEDNSFYIEAMGKTEEKIYRTCFRAREVRFEAIFVNFAANLADPRPHRLGQSFCGYWASCTMSLFIAYCRRFCLDAEDLYKQAYDDRDEADDTFTSADQERIFAHALWEGIEIPEVWDAEAVGLLGKQLTNINYHQLHSKLNEFADIGVLDATAAGIELAASAARQHQPQQQQLTA